MRALALGKLPDLPKEEAPVYEFERRVVSTASLTPHYEWQVRGTAADDDRRDFASNYARYRENQVRGTTTAAGCLITCELPESEIRLGDLPATVRMQVSVAPIEVTAFGEAGRHFASGLPDVVGEIDLRVRTPENVLRRGFTLCAVNSPLFDSLVGRRFEETGFWPISETEYQVQFRERR